MLCNYRCVSILGATYMNYFILSLSKDARFLAVFIRMDSITPKNELTTSEYEYFIVEKNIEIDWQNRCRRNVAGCPPASSKKIR
jgi:hypothetical protein